MEMVPSKTSHGTGEVADGGVVERDAVFGEITKDGPNYRSVGWFGTTALMMKTQFGLGVLSMPVVYDTMGIIPGILLVIDIAGITTWSNYMVGTFKARHPEVYSIADVGKMFFGRLGYEVFGGGYALYFTFIAGSGMLSVSIALNALTLHGSCTCVFVAVAAVAGFLIASIRTLGKISCLAYIGIISIMTSILTVTIAVSMQEKPTYASRDANWESDFKFFNTPNFAEAMSAIGTVIFTYAGTPGFFNIISEMRNPKDYRKSLAVCQITVTIFYIAVATVVYYYCGSSVASPALGSAGPLVKRVAYGLALPGLLITIVVFVHLPAKHIFVRALRGTKHLTSNTRIHWAVWLASTFGVTLVAYLVASGIPIFAGLVSLIGSLLATFLTFQPYGGMWLYDNWKVSKEKQTVRWKLMVVWSLFVILVGTFLMTGGTYGAVMGIIKSFNETKGSQPWSCADNSNSV